MKQFTVRKLTQATLVTSFRVYAETAEEAVHLLRSEEDSWYVNSYLELTSHEPSATVHGVLPVKAEIIDLLEDAEYSACIVK